MTSDVQFQICLLIGADHYWDIVEYDIIRSLGSTAAKSQIDYFLSGPVLNPSPASSAFNASILKVIVLNESENILNTALERFRNLESTRILPTQAEVNPTRYRVPDFFHTTPERSIFCEVAMDHAALPPNELCKEPHTLTAYHTTIHKQLKRGFIEEVSNPRITTGHA